MLQTYKLRLSDGTVLGVDHDGLSTWLVDRSAMVQAAGSRQWQPLRDFLAQERAAARRTSRYVLRKPTARQELPLVYPKPRADQAPAPPSPEAPPESAPPESAPPESASLEPPAIVEPVDVQALAEEPSAPSGESAPQLSIPEPEILSVSPEPQAATSPEESPDSEWSESLEPPFVSEPLNLQAFVEEPPVPSPESTPQPSVRDEDGPLIPVEPLAAEPAPVPPHFPWREKVEPPSLGELLDMEILAEEPPVPILHLSSAQSLPQDDVPLIPLEDLDFVAPDPPAASSWRDSLEPPPWAAPPPSLQVLADDPVARPDEVTTPTPVQADALPIIPLKPLEEEAPPFRAAEPGTAEEEEGGLPALAPWRARLEEILLRLISTCHVLFTEGSKRLAGSKWGWSRMVSKVAEARRRLSARWVGLTAGTSPFDHQDPPWASAPVNEVAAMGVVAPVSSQSLEPPPAIAELPALRLADAPEPEKTGDVYEGESFRHDTWRRAKPIAMAGALVACGLAAALTWQTWVTSAARFGQMVVGEIDRQVESRDQAARQRQALQEATAQLPHLSPATIRLVMSASPTGVLDPTEVFALSCDAADRGLPALTSDEAGELKALRLALLNTLRPSERARVRDYDSVRARRPPFAFENRDVLDLFASGARVLPSDSRERLRELWGKAIAAGLAVPPEDAPPPAPGR